MKARYKAIIITGVLAILFVLSFKFYGYDNTWRLWNIPVMSPHFADLRTITNGADSVAQGYDPMIENPADPWHRKMNYPRIWQSLYALGINKSHTIYLGVAIMVLFMTGICLLLPDASNLTLLLVFSAVLSPATLLGMERGNIDLLMFFLASVTIVAAQRSYLLSGFVIFAGFILKLFPVFECAIFLGADKRKCQKYILATAIIAGLYAAYTWSDLILIREGTPKSTVISYGLNILWMTINATNEKLGTITRIASYLTCALILLFSLSSLLRDDDRQEYSNTLHLDSFRLGAAIFIGTFLLGNNWDYRLIFLIFTLPQLISWSRCQASGIAKISKLTLGTIFISLWHLIIQRIFSKLSHGDPIAFTLDELAHWLTFSCLTYLMTWSLPNWIKIKTQKVCSQ